MRHAEAERGGYGNNFAPGPFGLAGFSVVTDASDIISRQACCSGLGMRASAAIRDYQLQIRGRLRL
jgi:hypothetical protein